MSFSGQGCLLAQLCTERWQSWRCSPFWHRRPDAVVCHQVLDERSRLTPQNLLWNKTWSRRHSTPTKFRCIIVLNCKVSHYTRQTARVEHDLLHREGLDKRDSSMAVKVIKVGIPSPLVVVPWLCAPLEPGGSVIFLLIFAGQHQDWSKLVH